MATKTLRVTLADVLGPGGPTGRVHGEVWVAYVDGDGSPREIRYTDGTVVVPSKPRQALNAAGYADFVVIPSDDSSILAADRGFGVKVGWDLTARGEHGAKVPVKNAGKVVQVVTADAATVQFGLKADYAPVMPGSTYLTEAVGDVRYATPGQATSAATAAAATEGDLRLPLAPAPTGTDLAALQSFLTANAGKKVAMRQAASYTIAGTLTVGAGTTIEMQGATITQASNLTPIFTTTADGFDVSGGTFIGKTTDYADTTASYVSSVIRANTGAKRVRIARCLIKGFAGAAVYASNTAGVAVEKCTIIGVGNGGGAGTFAFVSGTSKDNAGVIFDGTCSRVFISDNDISYTAQGILGGSGTTGVHIHDNEIHDIGGQHGVYLNYTAGASIAGNNIKSVAGAGVKVQTQSGGADSTGVAVTGNSIDTCGANGIIFTCDSGSLRHRTAAVTGNTIRSASNDGIVLEYVEGGVCTGNIIKGARAGIRVTDVVGVSVKSNRIATTTEDGILIQALDFNTSDITVESNEVRDCASANGAATEFGLRIAAGGGFTCTDVRVVGNDIRDSLGNMRYGYYYSVTDQSTISTLRNYTSGATDYGYRGPATAAREFYGNSFAGTLGAIHTAPTNFVVNADTSGATLTALETEVNELKAVLRTAGLIR